MRRSAETVIKEISDRMAELDEILDGRASDTEVASDLRAMHRARCQAEAMCSKLAGELDATGAWAAEGAHGAWQWMAASLRVEKAEATATVRDARCLRRMPLTERAFARGDVSASHVRLLALAQRTSAGDFAEGEWHLLDDALRMRFSDFRRAVDYWRHHADPDRGERDARRRHQLRSVHCSESFQGCRILSGTLEPVGGAIVGGELERLERLMFAADWQQAEAALGRRPRLDELGRTGAQRRHDALVEMATRSHALPDGTPRPRPLITYVVGHPVWPMISQLAGGAVITPGQALPLLHDFDIERVVFGPGGRAIDVGPRRRFFTGATRRAVEVRDLGCTHPMCEVGYEQCEVDHIVPWAAGGPTVQANGRCACPRHNRARPRSSLDPSGEDDDPAGW